MNNKVLVTGAAGFIGSHVCDHLVNAGYNVIALDDLSGGFEDNVNTAATFINGSITNVDLVNQLFASHRFEYVFHLAAYAAEASAILYAGLIIPIILLAASTLLMLP
ncbi:MAG: NAD-dependent epimerase/dehydratase family protein [Sphingobacteriaceae bacterium]|nr:NAD-dependent epimerase/dehydratase family protein [Sphingobacteriaceae bacterium]